MARKPEWFANLEGILERLQTLHLDLPLNRVDVGTIFSVKRTEANRILEIAGGIAPGKGRRRTIKASELIAYVESRRPEVKKERKRRNAIAHVVAEESSLTPAKYSTFRLPKVPSFDDLSGIEFEPGGTLQIHFDSFEDIMVKLVALSKAMLHQQGRFEEMVEESLRPDCSLEVRAPLNTGDASEAVSGSRSDL